MDKSPIRILIVEDYEPWRSYYSTALSKDQGFQVVGEASNGLDAVQRAQELQPDLILLDIGLPALNGIEAARQIRKVSPASKILFISENRAVEIATEALGTGASGYVVKSDAASQLLPAVEAVLAGGRFVSPGLFGEDANLPMNDLDRRTAHSHEVAFYADDTSVVNGYARFVGSSLAAGNAVIAVLTEAHMGSLLLKLEADGLDVLAAVEQGRFIPLDAADTLSKLMVDDMPDPARCTKVFGAVIEQATKGVKDANARVKACGEMAPTLLSKGNAEAAIKLEHLWDEITRGYGVHTLCGYLSSAFPQHATDPAFQRICAEHSAVHGWGAGWASGT